MPQTLLSSSSISVSAYTPNTFALDGGAMFGSVPKVIWEKLVTSDGCNRIPLAARALRIEHPEGVLWIDSGIGAFWNEKERERFSIIQEEALSGIASEHQLLLTHLHFDHAGGIVDLFSSNNLPKLILQEPHLTHALAPSRKESASFLPQVLNVVNSTPITLLNGESEILPMVTVSFSHGHTRFLQVVRIQAGNDVAYFPSDLMPTSHHIHPAYHMGYDIHAELLLSEKLQFLEKVVAEKAWIIFQHDPKIVMAKVLATSNFTYTLTDQITQS